MTDSLDQVDVLIRVTESMGPALKALLNKLNEEDRVACIVYDFMLWWVGQLGKDLRISAYIFYPMSASFYSYLINMPGFVSQGRLPLRANSTDVSDQFNIFKIAGFPSLHVSEVPDISWDPNPVCSFEYVLRCAMRWRDAMGILLSTVYELEEEVIEGLRKLAPEMDIRTVGPILPSSFLRGESGRGTSSVTCLDWLDKQPEASVLYIAFGTIAYLPKEQLQELAMGLEASKERFLWVIRIPAEQGTAEVGGEELLLKEFEERVRERGMVLWELAPQRKILAHKAVGGFLTHCGWNSTMEGLCKGVPTLCCPMFADQGMNGKWVEEVLQTGKLLKRGQDDIVRREEVEVKVREVMQRTTPMRLSASRIRDLASNAALHPAGSSQKNLHAFVDSLFNHSGSK